MQNTIGMRLGTCELEFLGRAARSATTAELHDTAVEFAQQFQFERWIYGISGPDAVMASRYPDEWIAGYVRNRLHRGSDPLFDALRARRAAVHWDLRRRRPFGQDLSAAQKAVLRDRWHFGAKHGITAPVFDSLQRPYEFGVLSFTRAAPLTSIEQWHQEPRVQLFAAYFHTVAATLLLTETAIPLDGAAPVLSSREYDCLSWAARGKTNWEIGQLLGVSKPTVNFHLINVARKLGVRGRAASIAKATRLRLIEPV